MIDAECYIRVGTLVKADNVVVITCEHRSKYHSKLPMHSVNWNQALVIGWVVGVDHEVVWDRCITCAALMHQMQAELSCREI